MRNTRSNTKSHSPPAPVLSPPASQDSGILQEPLGDQSKFIDGLLMTHSHRPAPIPSDKGPISGPPRRKGKSPIRQKPQTKPITASASTSASTTRKSSSRKRQSSEDTEVDPIDPIESDSGIGLQRKRMKVERVGTIQMYNQSGVVINVFNFPQK